MPHYASPYDPASMPRNLEHVRYEKKNHVAHVTINRPQVLNALHSYAYAELRACWRDIGLDPDIYVGIVTGAGKAFCAGRDVKFLAEHQAKGVRTPHEDPNNPLFFWGGGGQPSDANLEKPLIAAINGLAVGVGLSLALQCQLRIMADTAWIGDTHTRIGRLGSCHNLYTALPRTTAAYLTLCNGRLTAQECLAQAIVNKVVPARSVDGRGRRDGADGVRELAARGAGRRAPVSPHRRVSRAARRVRQAARPGDRRERGRRRGRARMEGRPQARVEAALGKSWCRAGLE